MFVLQPGEAHMPSVVQFFASHVSCTKSSFHESATQSQSPFTYALAGKGNRKVGIRVFSLRFFPLHCCARGSYSGS